jgi:hypothetical protein
MGTSLLMHFSSLLLGFLDTEPLPDPAVATSGLGVAYPAPLLLRRKPRGAIEAAEVGHAVQ